MDKIIYTRGTYSKEAQKIEMDVRENLDIWDFKMICKRLAGALGYNNKSIEEAFGENPSSKEKDIKRLLKD
tara:strand:- start:49315 stop:49527 length:213 start_codon:yes stop_codon:yes gene_type:complete